MPWTPQGVDNLAWWCRMTQAPVAAIGGVLGAKEVYIAARCGADGVCMVRGLGEDPKQVLPALVAAIEAGRKEHELTPMQRTWPHPSLPST
jgi:thiamine monophosphate synthase